MTLRLPLACTALAIALLLITVPAVSAHHMRGCDDTDLKTCSANWQVSQAPVPFWWDSQVHDELGHEDQPVWIEIDSTSVSQDPYVIDLQATGNAVASLDVWKVREQTPKAHTDITPDCPQGFVEDLYNEPGQTAGSPGHLQHVHDLVLEHHQTLLPLSLDEGETTADRQGSLTLELPRDQTWMVVVDARAATNLLDPHDPTFQQSEVFYRISVDGGDFDADARAPPEYPFDHEKWEQNANACMTNVPTPP